MAGGLFVIDQQFFFEIGAYDEYMDIWVGENIENIEMSGISHLATWSFVGDGSLEDLTEQDQSAQFWPRKRS